MLDGKEEETVSISIVKSASMIKMPVCVVRLFARIAEILHPHAAAAASDRDGRAKILCMHLSFILCKDY